MTKHEEIKPAKPTGLDLMRAPFAPHQISKLPKPTRQQTDEVKADFKKGIRCTVCGLWHHPKVVHLDYVGHAALTDRLLDCDPAWNWEPLVFGPDGAPALDENCGMWIRLTVCGQTRLGYGHAEGKRGGDAIKEVIGDALRNAAMRFGAALELWHKGELHVDDATQANPVPEPRRTVSPDQFIKLRDLAERAGVDAARVCERYEATSLEEFPTAKFEAAVKSLNATIAAKSPKSAEIDDEIPEFGGSK